MTPAEVTFTIEIDKDKTVLRFSMSSSKENISFILTASQALDISDALCDSAFKLVSSGLRKTREVN